MRRCPFEKLRLQYHNGPTESAQGHGPPAVSRSLGLLLVGLGHRRGVEPAEVVVGGQAVLGVGEVVHVEHRVHGRALAPQVLHVVERLLGEPVPERRPIGELERDLAALVVEAIGGHDRVDHAELVRPLRRHAAAEEDELLGDAGRELEPVGEVLDAGDAHAVHRVLEEGVVGGHDQVAHPRQHQPAGDAGTLHRGDRRLGEVSPATTHAAYDLVRSRVAELGRRLVRVVGHQQLAIERQVDVTTRGADVVARREVLALALQDHDPDVVIVGGPSEGIVEGVGHLGVLGVVEAGPVHDDPGDRPFDLVAHRGVGLVLDSGRVGLRVRHRVLPGFGSGSGWMGVLTRHRSRRRDGSVRSRGCGRSGHGARRRHPTCGRAPRCA